MDSGSIEIGRPSRRYDRFAEYESAPAKNQPNQQARANSGARLSVPLKRPLTLLEPWMSADPDLIPNLNKEGVFQYLTGEGYIVTRWAVEQAVRRRELKPVRIGRRNLFSRAKARAWVDSREQSGIYRSPETVAHQ